jgi:hypothetical protein
MDDSCRCEQYKSYLSDVANIGSRHENSRRFYMSVISALFVLLSMGKPDGVFAAFTGPVVWLVGFVGLLLCLAWILHMQAFGALYAAKFTVLRELETEAKLFPLFKREWEALQNDTRYRHLTRLDLWVPVLFAIVFVALVFIKR